MKIYTRTGDAGQTSLVGGTRVAKDSPRLEAYGTLDELNSFIGLLLCSSDLPKPEWQTLTSVQNRLFNLGAYLATPASDASGPSDPQGIDSQEIARLEEQIDRLTDLIPPQRSFILPAGSRTAALAHVCRTVCRRAERRVITLATDVPLSPLPVRYLNRLSDYLFTLPRYANHLAGIPETPWQP